MSTQPLQQGEEHKIRKGVILAALGVVFGDIGTSPLYAVKECFMHQHGLPGQSDVLGILSLIIWLMIVVVTIKYVVFVLRADRNGEGGILSLVQLVMDKNKSGPAMRKGWRLGFIPILGIFGAALLYSDGTITPAISVLSAVEGLSVVTDVFDHMIIPITIGILIGLFSIQSRGTSSVGGWFGPITLVWFISIGLAGLNWLVRTPEVLMAFDPRYGMNYLINGGWSGLRILGAVVLVVTGAEALYADMGHFGRKPIQRAWFFIVLPCLFLNYLGQGAFLLNEPIMENVSNPFFRMLPTWSLIPMVIIATLAAIVASQALISGAFSLTMQAMQMGFFPRLEIRHTSRHTHGQVYIPFINWSLMLACIGLVLVFKDSGSLAGAYSIAIVMVMIITSILFLRVFVYNWNWNKWLAYGVSSIFISIDLILIIGNLPKIFVGGYFTILLALSISIIMATWSTGRFLLGKKLFSGGLTQEELIASVKRSEDKITRVKGVAVFMSSSSQRVPVALLHNMKHNKVLHECVIFLSIQTLSVPYVKMNELVVVEKLEEGFWRVTGRYGYMQNPSVPKLLQLCREKQLSIDEMKTTYFLGRESLLTGKSRVFSSWRQRLFVIMSRLSQQPARYFAIPPGRVIELGVQVDFTDVKE